MDVDAARDAFDAMNDDDKARVRALVKSGQDRVKVVESIVNQNAAYASSQPTTGEKMKARALGVAESPLLPDTSIPGLVTSAFNPAALPITSTMKALRSLAPYSEAVESAKERAPGEFGEGQLAGAAASAATAAAPSVISGARALGGAAKSGGAAKLADASKAIDNIAASKAGKIADVVTDKLPVVSNVKQLFKLPNDIRKILTKDAPKAAEAAPTPATPTAALRKLVDDMPPEVAMGGKPPPKPAPDMPADVMTADLRAQAVKMLDDVEVAPAPPPATPAPSKVVPPSLQGPNANKVPLYPHAEPGDPGYGVMVTLDEFDALMQAGKVRPIPPPHTPTPQELAASMPKAPSAPVIKSDAELKAAVKAGVEAGVPLKQLAKQLGVTQGSINAFYKSAQIGNL